MRYINFTNHLCNKHPFLFVQNNLNWEDDG